MIDEKKLIEELREKNYNIVFSIGDQRLLNKVIRIIKEQPKVDEWIPFTVDEDGILNCELPEDEQKVLVTDGETVWLDTFINDDDYGCHLAYNNLDLLDLAWQPLPKPYKGEINNVNY